MGCLTPSQFAGRDVLREQCSCATGRKLSEEPVAVVLLNHLNLQVISWLVLKG